MTNICQAIEEELICIKLAEDNGQDMLLGYGSNYGSGMNLAKWRDILLHPETMRIEVSRDFSKTCVGLLRNAVDEGTIDQTYKVKHPVVMYINDIRNDDAKHLSNGVFILNYSGGHTAWVKDITRISKVANREVGVSIPLSEKDTYNPETIKIMGANITEIRKELNVANTKLAAVLYVMSQPNFVSQTTVGSNSVRKKLEKKKGIPKERWSRIQWNVGKHVQREVRETMGEEHCTALHRVRGFYRKAKSHYNNVKKIDGKWFQWIEPFWRGHPAFGIVKSSYAPNFTEEEGL
tara:strand:- start:382 stop:1257 length:876 start_codon:yes stop_codon:yes gene_type:complete